MVGASARLGSPPMDWGPGRYERIAAGLLPAAAAAAEFELADHPIWVGTREVLESRGDWQALRERAIERFTSANEDPAAFCVTSR